MGENKSLKYENSAKSLLDKIHVKEEFFSSLDEAKAHVYHSMNFEISAEYGVNIASSSDFKNKKIADIGGSSGGLLWGIKRVFPHIEGVVFDTEAACLTGEILTDEISFKRYNFFTDTFDCGNFDCVILSNILHDWNDQDSALILNNTVKNMGANQKLIIHEDILFDEALAPAQTLMYGLRLSINVFGGKQRKVSEIMKLVTAANPKAELSVFKTFDVLSLMVIEF